jgi:hypothetical protein
MSTDQMEESLQRRPDEKRGGHVLVQRFGRLEIKQLEFFGHLPSMSSSFRGALLSVLDTAREVEFLSIP